MIRWLLSKLGGEGFKGDYLPLVKIVQCFIRQKVLFTNFGVPWPVDKTTRVIAPHKINRGTRYPGLSMGCHIDGRNGIEFGANVWIGPRVSVISMNHDPNDYHNFLSSEPIKIGDNCWLGANTVILPGIELGEHTIVAAGAVVTKSFPNKNQVLAGVPARIVKQLGNYRESAST
ncbi:acyltransferase [Idiomarina sp.]|uniref:acyltransferase n=1 Tax=Idiomarina sp. TaxID=1874361 RepID=UPI001DEBF86D|nr:acyltransferase [Idiomarina sp.]MCJ8316220.1 acyltransferase [Idiomarina sp.]NQZ16133.1 acyltransferase [Idiomarina sp.]